MDAGFCVAGVSEDFSRWIRPTRESGQISGSDLQDVRSRPVQPLDLVSFDLLHNAPNAPHSEDWIANPGSRPVVVRRPSEDQRKAVLERATESSPAPVLAKTTRSLVLVEPDEIDSLVFDPDVFGKYKVRLSFSLAGKPYRGEAATPGYPCTDIKLRNWGRRFRSRRELDAMSIRKLMGVERVFLVLGLARKFNNNYWPMIVGFHTLPDYPGVIDLSNP